MTVANHRAPSKSPTAPAAPTPPREPLLHAAPILATFRRQLGSLLLNPLGYVYILAFVLSSAAILYWSDSFYTRDIADLSPLVRAMPWLLALLLPAVAMGSWASERELGTEEQLLTFPMTVADALVGKWLGIVAYFTLALLFSLSNVLVLRWLGNPDGGLIFATYVGWWLAGCVCAALGLLASTLVPLPAIAFVIGALLCGAAMSLVWLTDWLDPFNRGLISLGRVVTTAVAVALILGLAGLLLSARRWHPNRRRQTLGWAAVFACLCVTGINLGAVADRATFDWDVTAEKLSSLSPASRTVLHDLPQPVKIVAFISRQLPPELQLKAKEVESTLKSIERSSDGRLKVEIHRPGDSLDADGSLATQYYGLTPRRVTISTVTGRQEAEVFLAASVSSGTRVQRIDHFDPGLSVEYELVRAARSVGTPKKKVIGVVQTDLHMLGGFDPTGRFGGASPEPRWQIVREWERQYDVREVNLDAPVGDDVSVLVVPQPSRLPADQLRRLHDYIWAGRPALILEDPLPMFSGPQLATSQPKRPNPMMGGAPPEDSSGEFHQLLTSLGLDAPSDQILWSDYNPSRAFRRILPAGFIWCARDQGGFSDSPVMTGIQSLLLPFPGLVRPAADHGDLTITPLVTPAVTSSWGTNSFRDYVTFDPFSGGMRQVEPHRYLPENGAPPAVAVQITGKMRRAFPFEPKPSSATHPTTHPATAPTGVGDLGSSSVHVIYVADVDLAHDQFFEFYRNADNRFSQDELRFLQDLRNVQFLSNAVDALAGDESFLQLRSRRPQRRPLERLDQVLAGTQKELRDVQSAAQKDADAKIARLRDDIQQRLDRIRDRKDLDAQAREQLVAQVERSANRQLDKDIQEVNHEADLKTRKAQIEQQRQFEHVLNYGVRAKALGFPAVVLAALAMTVFAVRLRGERLDIPESRRRRHRS